MASATAKSAKSEAWFPCWLGPPLLVAAFVALARWSWRKWPDVFLDFGSQLYIPWRLSEGAALYVDIDYKDGPLSQYLNALWFALFGVGLDTIVWANLVLLVGLCVLVYAIFARACGHFTATLAVLVQLTVFTFSQYTRVANYNYVCPYAQEQTHGLLLAVLMIFCLGECARQGRARFASLAGLALGLTSLTKAELAMPALAAALLGLGLVGLTRAPDAAPLRTVLVAFVAGVLAPVIACVSLLATQMPLATAMRGAAGNWIHLRGDILDYQFYRVGMGLDDPWGNALLALTAFAAIVAVVAVAVGAAHVTRAVRRGRVPLAIVAGVACGALMVASWSWVAWSSVGRALPLTSALGLLVCTWQVTVHRSERRTAIRWVTPAIWSAFALLLLGKVVLDVRISHYGFVLALPATLTLIAMLIHVLPATLEARGINGAIARALLVAPIVAFSLFFLQWSNRTYSYKNTVVGEGRDALVTTDESTDPRGAVMQRAAERFGPLMPPGTTLMTMPDGLMLNYWLRRVNPTRHIYFVPWSLAFANGEAAVLADIQRQPPDFIVVVDRKATEYGFRAFGDEGFGGLILPWVRANYRRITRIGFEPLTGRGFGILLLAYSPPPTKLPAATLRSPGA